MISLLIAFLLFLTPSSNIDDIKGQQPNVAIDTRGTIRIVYGEGEKIYCMSSSNSGGTFSEPVFVAQVKDMHLGHTRGPQIASSKNYSLITAMDKDGNIHSYKLKHDNSKWQKTANVSDSKTAPEGLMALTADTDDNFYATWLDTRLEKKNNIFFSSIKGSSSKWSDNTLVYQSPDGHVCECCKPNISSSNGRIIIGFRNWLMGSRDIYYAVSSNKGKSFSAPAKTGSGTWRLNACPMDGGGLAISEKGVPAAAWRRNTDVYYWSGSDSEKKIGTGRDVSMSQSKGTTLIAWQDNNKIKVMNLKKNKTSEIGKGISPRVYALPNGNGICVWEDDKVVRYKVINT